MKTTIFLLIAIISASAHAVSFTWNSNGVKISFNGDVTLAQSSSITANLVWLGTSSSATVSNYEISNGTIVQSVNTTSTGLSSTRGVYSAKFSEQIPGTIDGKPFVAGDYFTVLLTYTDGDNTAWYNLSSDVYRLPTDAVDTTQGLTAGFSHSFTMQEKGTALSAGGGWVAAAAVPEPATGALALAGIALLFKRRKARV